MAISLEELAAGALEGSVGPWTLAIGAGALAVALAAGSGKPLRRMSSTGAFAAGRTGQLNLTGLSGWIGSQRQNWQALVAEARAEYEAERQAALTEVDPEQHAPEAAALNATAAGPAEASPADMPAADATAQDHADGPGRDRRGRFVRRAAATNGTHSE
ncbi:MAG: hypothetical protein AB7K36_29475 [Chloroflexota bacterium]